jgi:hypothetical protein
MSLQMFLCKCEMPYCCTLQKEEEEAEFAEQLQVSELGAQLQGSMFSKAETTDEVFLLILMIPDSVNVGAV